MKLERIRTELPPVRLRVTLPGDLKATLDAYAIYYREQYGDVVGLEELIPQILTTFVSTDRAFRLWQHSHPQPDAPTFSQRSAHTPHAKNRRKVTLAKNNQDTTHNEVSAHESAH